MPVIRIVFTIVISVFTLLLLSSCKDSSTEETTTTTREIILSTTAQDKSQQTTAATTKNGTDTDRLIDTYIVLDDDKTAINGNGATYSGGTVTITEPGTYSLEGTLSNGKIFISTENENKKVKLYFNGVNISCNDDAPLFIERSPEETVIILGDDSINSLTNSANIQGSDPKTAGIYSKDDLQIEGTGTLNITSKLGRGILFKEDIEIKSGILNITATDDGITGKDDVEIKGGTVNFTLINDNSVSDDPSVAQ